MPEQFSTITGIMQEELIYYSPEPVEELARREEISRALEQIKSRRFFPYLV